ncbi:hypothetical protein P9112_008700 [Eukaryota sp. TZLM1-RC]
MTDSEDDPVVQEYDVFLSHTLEENLFLCQFPTRPPWRPLNFDQVSQARYKPQQGALELEIEHDFPEHCKDEFGHNPRSTSLFSALNVPLKTNMTVGSVRGNQIYLTPLHHAMQLRPRFKHIEEDETIDMVGDGSKPTDEGSDMEGSSLIQQKRKAAKASKEPTVVVRQSYYSKYKAKRDAESWLPMSIVKHDQQLANQIKNAMAQTSNNSVPTVGSKNDYLNLLFPEAHLPSIDKVDSTMIGSEVAVDEQVSNLSLTESPAFKALQEFILRELGIHGVLNITSIIKLINTYNSSVPEQSQLSSDINTVLHVLGHSADHIGECWFLHTDSALEPYRRILVRLFKESNKPIQKADLVTACRHENVKDFGYKVYNLLMNQLAEKAPGTHSKWKLKSGNV